MILMITYGLEAFAFMMRNDNSDTKLYEPPLSPHNF